MPHEEADHLGLAQREVVEVVGVPQCALGRNMKERSLKQSDTNALYLFLRHIVDVLPSEGGDDSNG